KTVGAKQWSRRRAFNNCIRHVSDEIIDVALQVIGGKLNLVFVAAFDGEHGHPVEWGIMELLAKFDLLFIEAKKVVTAGALDGGVKRGESLHENFTFDIAT